MGDISPHRLKISQIRALVAIADAGTFSDAALQLDLSQSAVSHAIATFEEELGVVLLNRGRQGAALTPLGEKVTAEARVILTSLETIVQQAQQARGLQQGQVRIACFRSVATHILPEVIQQFRDRYPGIQIKINECLNYRGVENEVRQGRADLGFTYLPTTDEFEVRQLMHDHYMLLLPPRYKGNTGPMSWETLLRLPLILPPVEDGCRNIIDRYFAKAGYTINPAYEVREDSTILSMVQQGLGATILAKLAAEPVPPELIVAELPISMERIIGVMQLKDALLPPSVYVFMDMLKQVWSQSNSLMRVV
ncbi:MAG: LysR family transcriptional regulator [Leptolyngbya sp. SIO1D8]|nr:LysR family transcriptional regulator [Leptolyngbya sp. SIO1D8]